MPKPTASKVEEVKKKKNYGQTTSNSQQKSGTLQSLKAQALDSAVKRQRYDNQRTANQYAQRSVTTDVLNRLNNSPGQTKAPGTTSRPYKNSLNDDTNRYNSQYRDVNSYSKLELQTKLEEAQKEYEQKKKAYQLSEYYEPGDLIPHFDERKNDEYLDAFDQFRALKSAYESYDSRMTAQKEKQFKEAMGGASYEALRANIESGYLNPQQRKWAEELALDKATPQQANERIAAINEKIKSMGNFQTRMASETTYADDILLQSLKNEKKSYEDTQWMRERDYEYGNMQATKAEASMPKGQSFGAYNDQYRTIMGLATDEEILAGRVNDPERWAQANTAYRYRDVMTQQEKYNYAKLYNESPDRANDYLDWLGYDLDQRLQSQTTERVNTTMDALRNAENLVPDTGIGWLDKLTERGAKQGVEGWAFTGARVANVASGFGAIDATLQKLINPDGRPINWNTPAFTGHTVTQAVTENQLSQIDDPIMQMFYQTGGSMADSLVVIGASLIGLPGATAILGGAAATDSMLKAKERGATDTQAVTVGILSGVAESLFEEVSLEKLLTAGTPATWQEAIKNMLARQGFTEASEEVATTIANTITDAIIMGDKSELKTNIRKYIEMGYSPSDAQKLGAIDWSKDLFMDAIGGFLSGAVFGGVEQGLSYAQFRGANKNLSQSQSTASAIENYADAMQMVLDEEGNVRRDSANAAKQLQETYQRTMEGLTDRSTQYEEEAYFIDQQVEQGQITPEEAEVKKVFLEFAMGERSYNQTTQEQRAKRAEELDKKARGIVQNMAEKSTATISSAQSIVDNYDSSIASPSEYFGAFRYYEEMGQQARATGNDNFAEVWKNDERYSGSITQHAAIVAFSAGKTTAAPATKIMQVTQRGTGTLTYSDEAMRQLANNVKSVNDAVELLSAFAKKTGFTVNLDESLADGENAKFIANAMTIAINPRANVIAGLFHESGHAVQRFNPKAYAQLKADMISWYAQTRGMTSLDTLVSAYGAEAYKGYSRDAIEIEIVNDAFGALFNRADAAEDIARWLAENKTEVEQKSFVEKLTDLIDRIVNWVKGLVNLDNVSPMQKRTVDMQVEKVQAFRKAFLDALDSASETARTAAEYYADFASDGNGHDNSMQSFADGLGFDLDEDLNLVDKDGNRVTHVTGEMIRKSKVGAMLEYAAEHGRISYKDMRKEASMLAGILNMALEKGDNNLMMYWEVAGSMVFSALKDNSDKQYGLTVDMSTICAKTKAIVDAMSETMLRLGRGLTREEVEVVYYTTGKNGEPTPCPVCYVFSRWFGIGGLLDDISTFQKEYGKQSTKKDMEFAKRILAEIVEFKDNASKTKQKDYWSARDNALKYGRIASDMKSKYNSWISSAEKAIANSDTIRATISELQAQQAVVDEKAAKKLQTQINKEMKKKALLTDEQRQQKFDDIEGYKKSIHDIEAWQWLIKTKLSMDRDGNFAVNPLWAEQDGKDGREGVPPDILFDLNRGAEFASQYPLTWAYRTGKGSAMGKAMMPYSDVRVGEIAQGVAKGSVKEIKMGIDPDDEIKFNPFNADDAESVKKQLAILESAVKKTRRQNLIGGMRFQSTSDFRYEYGSDYLMAFLELQALGSNVQLYTKVIEAVDFLASMNADINLSAMPLGDGWYEDENGRHLQSSSVTGINFEAAVEMSRKYDNVQIIMVGINRNHILTCLEGDEVTFVIPFHGSGQNVAQIAYLMDMLRENLDVMRAQDYTNYQSDHDMLKDSRKLTDEEKKRGVNTWGLTIEEQARIKSMRELRMDILTGKLSSGLSEEQSALLKQSKFLGDLYNRFYVDENSREFGVTLEKDVAKQVFPYEYWDKTGNYDNADINGQRFVEYCAEIGYAPRFSGYNSKGQYNPEFDFYSNGQQKGYWKLLIDRPMYANRYDEQGNWVGYGDYREQKAINVSKFKMETIDPTWQTATYGNVMGAKNHSAKTEKIAEESIGYLNQGLRYDTATKTLVPKGQEVRPTKEGVESEEDEDADYSRAVDYDEMLALFDKIDTAVAENNVEELEVFYEEALKNPDKSIAGYIVMNFAEMRGYSPIALFHGTTTFGFTKFDLNNPSRNPWIFATESEKVAKGYAGRTGVKQIGSPKKGMSKEQVVATYATQNNIQAEYLTDEKRSGYANAFAYTIRKSYRDLQNATDKMADPDTGEIDLFAFLTDTADHNRAVDAFWDIMIDLELSVVPALDDLKKAVNGTANDELYRAASKARIDIAQNIQTLRDVIGSNLPAYNKSEVKQEVGDFLYGDRLIHMLNGLVDLLKLSSPTGLYKDAVAVGAGVFVEIQSFHDIESKVSGSSTGVYHLYGNPGSNPLIINAGGDEIFWTDLPIPDWIRDDMGYEEGDPVDTDTLAEWAKEKGYTSIYIENVDDNMPGSSEVANEYIFFSEEQVKSGDYVTYDDDGNVIPLSKRFDKMEDDIRYSRGTGTSLTDTERRTLEKRVREAERNAAKEKQRAEHFKSEMRLTPKFTPDATQISELATEISTMFGGTDVDTASIEKSLRDIFWNINEANSSGKEARAYTALDLAQKVAETVVGASVSEDMTTTLEGKMMRNEVVAMGANAIMDRVLQTRMAKSTAADKWNSKLQETRKALGQTETYAAKEAKRADQLESELQAYKQKMADQIAFLKAKADADHAFNRQAYEQRIARVRAQRDIALREQKEYYKGRVSNLQEQKRVAKVMPKVKKEVDALRKMLLSPDEKTYKYVPDIVKEAVTDFLSCVDFVTRTMAETGVALKSDAREVTKLDAIRKLAEQAKNMQNIDVEADYFLELPDDTVDAIDELRNRVVGLVNALQEAQKAGLVDSEIHVRTADSTTLELIRRLARVINHAVTNINRNYVQGRFAHVDEGARATIQFLDGVKRSPHYNRILGNSLLWSMSTPYYAFHRFGPGGDAVFENLGAGLSQFAKNIKTILNFVDETFTRDEQRKWSNQTVTVNVTNAKGEAQELTMTATQLMSLYCLARREAAQDHLYTGGITLQETKAGKTTISLEQAVHLTPESLFAAFDQLSGRQKEVAQKLQEFMSTVGSDWGNEVSMKRYGVNSFEEKFYFPMKTSDNGRATLKANDDDASSLYGMVNQGFTKHLQTNANNALVIDDVFSVFTDHSANMAKYNAMVLPLLDAMKWYNWTQRADTTTAEGDLNRNDISVKGAIKEAFGTGATQYFRQFIADLNSAKQEGGAGFDIGQRLLSNYKAAAVGANLRVALLQPTAFFRASMMLSPKDLARGAAMKGGNAEMDKYSGIWQWKDLGFYDTDIGRSVRRQIQGERTKVAEARNKIVDISMKAAEFGDQITWAAIWNACKIEQQRQNKGVSYEELMRLTERRFNQVIFATQVFDSTLSRSEVMRKRDPYHKIITAFMSEPTLSYNMVLDKFMQFNIDSQKLGRGKAWKKHGGAITRSLAVYTVTNLVAALAESIMDAYRDDDDEPWLEKFMEKMFGDWSEVDDIGSAVKALYSGNFMADMTVIGKIPLAKDIISLLQGYDIGGRMDTMAIQNIANLVKIWDEKYSIYTGKMDAKDATAVTWWGNMTLYGAIYKSLQALSQFIGVPLYNFMRDITPVYNETIGSLTGFKLDTYESTQERTRNTMKKQYGMTPAEEQFAKDNDLTKPFMEKFYTKTYKNLGVTPKQAGIPLEVFTEYSNKIDDSGATKKEEIMKIIDGMNISDAMKDKLYLVKYAQSKIDEAPWH